MNMFPLERFGQPVGAVLATVLDLQENQVRTDKHFATKHGLINDSNRGIEGNRKGCPFRVQMLK